jgi:hypothetical protein
MKTYHKIHTVFKRDQKNMRHIMYGDWSRPEFSYLRDNDWSWTEKVDGTNIRVMWDGEHVTFGGKTDNANLPAPLVERLRERFDGRENDFLRQFEGATEVCLYGEGYGPKIQKGGKYRDDQDFVLFDVNVHGWWLERSDMLDVASAFSLDAVPVVGEGSLLDAVRFVERGFTSTWGDFQAEGLVCRPLVGLKARNGSRIITKIKCRDLAG